MSHEQGSSSNSIPLLSSPSLGLLLFFTDAWERRRLNRRRGLGFMGRGEKKARKKTMGVTVATLLFTLFLSNRAPVHIVFFSFDLSMTLAC